MEDFDAESREKSSNEVGSSLIYSTIDDLGLSGGDYLISLLKRLT